MDCFLKNFGNPDDLPIIYVKYLFQLFISVLYVILSISILSLVEKYRRKKQKINWAVMLRASASFFLIFFHSSMIYLNVGISSCMSIDGTPKIVDNLVYNCYDKIHNVFTYIFVVPILFLWVFFLPIFTLRVLKKK